MSLRKTKNTIIAGDGSFIFLAFRVYCVILDAVVYVLFAFDVLDKMWNSIVHNLLVPDHCFSLNSATLHLVAERISVSTLDCLAVV